MQCQPCWLPRCVCVCVPDYQMIVILSSKTRCPAGRQMAMQGLHDRGRCSEETSDRPLMSRCLVAALVLSLIPPVTSCKNTFQFPPSGNTKRNCFPMCLFYGRSFSPGLCRVRISIIMLLLALTRSPASYFPFHINMRFHTSVTHTQTHKHIQTHPKEVRRIGLSVVLSLSRLYCLSV